MWKPFNQTVSTTFPIITLLRSSTFLFLFYFFFFKCSSSLSSLSPPNWSRFLLFGKKHNQTEIRAKFPSFESSCNWNDRNHARLWRRFTFYCIACHRYYVRNLERKRVEQNRGGGNRLDYVTKARSYPILMLKSLRSSLYLGCLSASFCEPINRAARVDCNLTSTAYITSDCDGCSFSGASSNPRLQSQWNRYELIE